MNYTGYGDSTKTGDNKYVLACFRADSNLGWVIDLRKFLNVPELKYREYTPHKQRVAANQRIQANLNHGLAESELTIIDVERYKLRAFLDLSLSGAEAGADYSQKTVNQLAADQMLRDSPFSFVSDTADFGIRANSTLRSPEHYSSRLQELPSFDPSTVRRGAGNKLNDVRVLTARANSIMSPTEYMELRLVISTPMLQMNFPKNYDRLCKLSHVFDTKHARSVPLLNGLVGQLAEASGIPRQIASSLAAGSPISEATSNTSDHIQAADFAAGWAADLLVATNNDYRALARQVRWITINGLSVPP